MKTGAQIVAAWLKDLEAHPEIDYDDMAALEHKIDAELREARELAHLGGWSK